MERPRARLRSSEALEALIQSETQPSNDSLRPARLPVGVTGAKVLVMAHSRALLERVESVAKSQLLEIVRVTRNTALAAAHETEPDAAIIELPGATGTLDRSFLELCRRLRADSGKRPLPIGFVCSDDTVARRSSAASAGGSLFLAEPIDSDSLGLAIQQLLAARNDSHPRVLLVIGGADAESSRGIASVLMEGEKIVSLLRDPTRILEALTRARSDLLLLDLPTSGPLGLDLCRVVRSHLEWQDIPVVMVVGDEPESRVAGLRAGADDVFVAPIDPAELAARLDGRIERMQMLRERFDKDTLTGLSLRRPFLQQLTRSLAESVRHARPLSIALLDVDLFKAVNDEHGHLVADGVLAALGRLLSTRFRAQDFSGRWGGEEFVVTFPGETPEVILPLLRKVLAELGETVFRGANGVGFSVTFSAGIASHMRDGRSVQALLDAADRRLYYAKRGGRAQVVAVDPS